MFEQFLRLSFLYPAFRQNKVHFGGRFQTKQHQFMQKLCTKKAYKKKHKKKQYDKLFTDHKNVNKSSQEFYGSFLKAEPQFCVSFLDICGRFLKIVEKSSEVSKKFTLQTKQVNCSGSINCCGNFATKQRIFLWKFVEQKILNLEGILQ